MMWAAFGLRARLESASVQVKRFLLPGVLGGLSPRAYPLIPDVWLFLSGRALSALPGPQYSWACQKRLPKVGIITVLASYLATVIHVG